MLLAFRQNLKERPQDFIITDEDHSTERKENYCPLQEDGSANPPKPQNTYEEYKQLGARLYQLKRELEYLTTRSEQLAGNVSLIESNLETTEANSKAASSAGNFRGEDSYKVSAQRLKGELADTKEELRKARIYKERAKEALEAFDQHERIAELQKELGL